MQRIIEVSKRIMVTERYKTYPLREITSWEDFCKLKIGTVIAIMNNCTMVEAVVHQQPNLSDDYIFVCEKDICNIITVRPSSFKYGNYMYVI